MASSSLVIRNYSGPWYCQVAPYGLPTRVALGAHCTSQGRNILFVDLVAHCGHRRECTKVSSTRQMTFRDGISRSSARRRRPMRTPTQAVGSVTSIGEQLTAGAW